MASQLKQSKMDVDSDPLQIKKVQKPAVGVSDFAKLITYASYIDKTVLIQEVLDELGNELITVPKRFGKTTVISMLKYFLSIEVDKQGIPVSKSALSKDPVLDTPNYRMFMDYNLKITENTGIMDSHFGKYPVIHADFNSSDVAGTTKHVATLCKAVVHRAYKEHEYLLASDKLSPDDKKLVSEWCNEVDHHNISGEQTAKGLAKLSKFLFLHFNKNCFLLVDNYDSPMLKAVSVTRHERAFSDIHRYLQSIYIELLDSGYRQEKHIYVCGSFITGISHYSRINFVEHIDFTNHNFLTEGSLARFFGFSENDVKNLFQTFGINEEFAAEALAYYKGYNMAGDVELYNFWSISSFLLKKKIGNYWFNSVMGPFLNRVFSPRIHAEIVELLRGNSIHVQLDDDDEWIEYYDENAVKKLRYLTVIGSGGNTEDLFGKNYFPLMTEEGYLTMASSIDNISALVRIPNNEVMNGLRTLTAKF